MSGNSDNSANASDRRAAPGKDRTDMGNSMERRAHQEPRIVEMNGSCTYDDGLHIHSGRGAGAIDQFIPQPRIRTGMKPGEAGATTPNPGDLLREPTARAARAVALALLDDLDAAYARLDRKRGRRADPEALHDFRVALRRLRSWLRAYRTDIQDSVGAKTVRRLGALARATTDSRDIEVHLEWIAGQQKTMTAAQRPGARWLLTTLRGEKKRSDASLRETLSADFMEVSARLRKNLARYAVAVWDQEVGDRWAVTAAGQIRDGFMKLRKDLAAIEDVNDDVQSHRARIAGKRLRYLIEPLASAIAAGPECVEHLKGLQDLLGSMHDAHVFSRVVRRHARSIVPARGKRARRDPRTGLRALATLLKARRTEAWTTFTSRWVESELGALSDGVHAIVRQLLETGGEGVEIERKYLLRKLPAEAKGAPVADITQGYLPGTKLVERLRRIKTGDKVRYVRTVKTGTGLVRTELEEECAYPVYKALWSLTRGKRVRKRRYRLADAGHVWEIDEFLDRKLVLAEIELLSATDPVTIPEWLGRYVVREVTGEPEYLNSVLAR